MVETFICPNKIYENFQGYQSPVFLSSKYQLILSANVFELSSTRSSFIIFSGNNKYLRQELFGF